MRMTTTIIGGTFEAKLAERMNFADHKTFRSMLQEVTTSGASTCVLDISELSAIDSAGLGMFIIAIEAAKTNGWSLLLKGANGQVKQLLQLAKFDKLLTMAE